MDRRINYSFYKTLLYSLIPMLVFFAGCSKLPDYPRPESQDNRINELIQEVKEERKVLTTTTAKSPYTGKLTTFKGSDELLPRELLRVFPAHRGQITDFDVSSDGLTAYSIGTDANVLQLRKRPDGRIERTVLFKGEKQPLVISLSPSERFLAVGFISAVVIYDLQQNSPSASLTQIYGRITEITWDPREELVLFGRADGKIHSWHVGNHRHAGQDSLDAVEEYLVGSSPITSVIFHPSGRIFFASERAGGVYIVRLLRTEKELGLRDEAAVIDEQSRGRHIQRLALLNTPVEALFLDDASDVLSVAISNGFLFRWKVRGTVRLPDLRLSPTSLVDVTGGNFGKPLIFAASRGAPLRVFCADVGSQPASSRGKQFDTAPSASPLGTVVPMSDDSIGGVLVTETLPIEGEITGLALSKNGAALWASQKTGNFLVFMARDELKRSKWQKKIANCASSL